jgi:hypothetical protein
MVTASWLEDPRYVQLCLLIAGNAVSWVPGNELCVSPSSHFVKNLSVVIWDPKTRTELTKPPRRHNRSRAKLRSIAPQKDIKLRNPPTKTSIFGVDRGNRFNQRRQVTRRRRCAARHKSHTKITWLGRRIPVQKNFQYYRIQHVKILCIVLILLTL